MLSAMACLIASQQHLTSATSLWGLLSCCFDHTRSIVTILGAQVNYKNVMKEYNLGPNGGILTSLNLFATRFDQVLVHLI